MSATQSTLAPVWPAAFLALAIAALGVFHVWSRTRVIVTGYELARLESEYRHLVAERDRLRIEVSTLREPGRLERFARARLGMAPPAPGAVVAGVSGGKVWAGGVVLGGADQRPGPAEPSKAAVRGVQVAMRGTGRTNTSAEAP